MHQTHLQLSFCCLSAARHSQSEFRQGKCNKQRPGASGRIATVTYPGPALVTGQCADFGKTKIPELRGLAARAPYFHNGSAARLQDVVNFYEHRFPIGLSAQENADLVNYLSAL